jgi:hypothetical protein
MFSFHANDYDILDAEIAFDEAQEKYPDNYMIVMNGHVLNKRLHGDIVAILTKDEYDALAMPKSIAPRFGVLEGVSILRGKVDNSLGIYL